MKIKLYIKIFGLMLALVCFTTICEAQNNATVAEKDTLIARFRRSLSYALDQTSWNSTLAVSTAHIASSATDSSFIIGTLNLYGTSSVAFNASYFGSNVHCRFTFSHLSLATGSTLGGVDLTTKIPSFITNSHITLDSMLISSNYADSTYSATTFFSNSAAGEMRYKGLTFNSFHADVTALRNAARQTTIDAHVMGSVTLGGSVGEFAAEVSANHLVNFTGILKPVNFNSLLSGIASNLGADFSPVVSPFLSSLTADSITVQTTDTTGYQVAAYLHSGDQFFASFGSADSLLTVFLNLKTVNLSNLSTIAGYDIKSYVPNFITNANFGLDSVKYQYDKKDRSYALHAFAGSHAGAGTVLTYQGLSLDTLSTNIHISRASVGASSLIDASVFGSVSLGTAATGQFSADIVANHFVNLDAILLKPHPINPSDILKSVVQSATSDISSLIAPLINFNIDSLYLKSLDTSSYKLTTFLKSGDQFEATFGFATKDSIVNLNLNLKTVTLMNLGTVAGYDLRNYMPNFITNANFGLDSVKYRYNKVLKSYALHVFAGSQAGAGAVLSYQGLSLDTLSTNISISRPSASANSLIDASVFGIVSLGTAATGQFSADVVANHFVNLDAILLKPKPINPSDILKSVVQSDASDISSLIAPLISFNIDSLSLESLDTSSYKLTTFLKSGDQFEATFGFAAKDSIVNLNLNLKTVTLMNLGTVAGFDLRKYIPTYISNANFGLDSVKYRYNKVLKSYALNVFAGSKAGAGAVLSYQGLTLDSLATNINISRAANHTNISGNLVGLVKFSTIQLTLSATADSSRITNLSAEATGAVSLGTVINSITGSSPDLAAYFNGFTVTGLSLTDSANLYQIRATTNAGNFYVRFGGRGDSIVTLKAQFKNFNTASLNTLVTEGFNLGDWTHSLPFSIPNISFDSLNYTYKKNAHNYDLALSFGLGSTGTYAGTSLDESYAVFTISKPNATTAAFMSATLGGTLKISNTRFALEGTVDNQKNWTISGTLLQRFTMGHIITEILEPIGSGLDVASILPSFFKDLSMDSLTVALNSDSSVVISSVIADKFVEVRRNVNGKYLAGFKFGGVPRLGSISHIFSPLDDVGLNDISFAYVNAAQTISNIGKIGKKATTAIFNNFSSTSLNQGFNLVAGFSPKIKGFPKPFNNIPKVNLKVIVPPTLGTLPQLEGDIDLGTLGNFSPKHFSLQSAFLSLATIELPIPSVTYGAGLKFKASLPTNATVTSFDLIDFTGDAKITLSAVGSTVNFEFFQNDGNDNIWHHPFGIPNLNLGSLGLLTGYTTDGPIPLFGISGKINFSGIERSGVGVFDAEIPEMSIISLTSGPVTSAGTQKLNLKKDILNLFLPDNIKVKALPPFLTDFELDTLSETIAPSGGTFFGVTYPQGFSFYSKAKMWGFSGRLSASIGLDGIKGTAKLAPYDFKIGGASILKINGVTNPTDSAEVSVDFSTDQITRNGDSLVYINAGVELLGAKGSAHVLIGNNGSYFKIHGQVYNLFDADIDATLRGTFENPKDFHIRANLSSTFREYLNTHVQSGLDAATKSEQRAYAKAKSDVTDAQAVVNDNATIQNAFNSASNAVHSAQNEVDRLQRLIDNVRGEIDDAQRHRDEAARNRCEACHKVFGKRYCLGAHSDLRCEARVAIDIIRYEAIRDAKKVELEGLKVSKSAADAVLSSLSRDLKVVGDKLQVIENGLASAVLYSANKTLSGFETATDGSLAAASAISNGVLGGGLFNVNSAQFEGELGNLANSKVSMSLNATFLNKDVSLSFGFDFNDVEGSILKLVRILTHTNYNQGKATEFIVGNRP